MAFKPIDNKRDQFRKYLEASGVIEVLSKSITKLMESPEKPDSPVEFIRENMGRSQKELKEIEFLKEEVEVYKKQVNDLKMEIAGLKLERQDVESALAKEVAVLADAATTVVVKEDPVPETQNDKQIVVETKKTEDPEPTPVLVVGTKTDDVPKVDNTTEAKGEEVSVVADATEAKIDVAKAEEDAKADDKQPAAAGDASSSETTDK